MTLARRVAPAGLSVLFRLTYLLIIVSTFVQVSPVLPSLPVLPGHVMFGVDNYNNWWWHDY